MVKLSPEVEKQIQDQTQAVVDKLVTLKKTTDLAAVSPLDLRHCVFQSLREHYLSQMETLA